MKSGFRVIDSEPHFEEPVDLWEKRLPEPWRSQTRLVQAPMEPGGPQFEFAGRRVERPSGEGNAVLEPIVRMQGLRRLEEVPQLKRAHLDGTPDVWIEGFDIEGIDVGVLMTSKAMSLIRYDDLDPQHSLALCQVFNDFAAEWTGASPDRLKWWGWLPPHDAELAAEEARRCVEELGAAGIAMTKGAINGNLLCDDFFEPLWAEVDKLGVPFGLHGPGTGGMRDNLRSRFKGHHRAETFASLGRWFYAHSAVCELILGGVLERHPNLKIVMMETGASWLTWLIWFMDEKWSRFRDDLDYRLPLSPREYFQRQCYAVVAPDEDAIRYVVEDIGDDNLVFSTDYPHNDSLFPHAVDTFLALQGIGDESKRKILWDNGAKLYGLEAPS